ncbi:unnamed protein product [Sympodiomycopsis kandeliae]
MPSISIPKADKGKSPLRGLPSTSVTSTSFSPTAVSEPCSSYASSSSAAASSSSAPRELQLILTTSCNDIFVYPKSVVEEGDPSDAPDPSVFVSSWESPLASRASLMISNVRLVVPIGAKCPERISSLQLTLSCSEAMAFPSGYYESNQPFKDKITVGEATNYAISPGNSYAWDIPLLVPWTAAPYTRGNLARNYWTLSAKVQFPGKMFLNNNKNLSATKNIFVISAPKEVSALTYQHIHTGIADGLGPIQLSFISSLFTVGGYLRGALLLPSPSSEMKIHGISMSIIQTVTLQSRKRTGYFEKCRDLRVEFMNLNGAELESQILHTGALCKSRPANANGEIELEWLTRLPTDEKARPSNQAGGDTHIRLSHHLELSLLYDVDKANPARDSKGNLLRKRYRITWPVDLISCAIRWQSWILPEYSAQDSNPVPDKGRDVWQGATEHETHDQCNCGESISQVLSSEVQSDYSSNDLLRQGLLAQGGQTVNSNGRNRSRHASSRRGPSVGSTTPVSHRSGPSTPSSSAGNSDRTGRSLNSRRPNSSSTPSSASMQTPRSNTPRRSRSRAISPDRISITYESEESERSSLSSTTDYEEEEEYDTEELMDKLERERIKREQLYDPVGTFDWDLEITRRMNKLNVEQ